MHITTRCIVLVMGIFAGFWSRAQSGRIDTFVLRFAFDQSEIRPSDTASLHHFAREKLHGLDSLGIIGYTDTVGTEMYNHGLSLRRALAVAAALRGWLPSDSMPPAGVEGRGEADPLPGDDSESRRVVVVCWHHFSSPPPLVARNDSFRNPAEPDTVFELEDIRFYANTANLTDAAKLILPRYINYLLTLRDRYLEVDGYCNSPGPPLAESDPLYVLSVKSWFIKARATPIREMPIPQRGRRWTGTCGWRSGCFNGNRSPEPTTADEGQNSHVK
jgi:outer membrane protein OmpA-like peptidoglycan-associated protein